MFNPKYGPGATINVDPETLHGRRAIENAAIISHEVNRGYCDAIGDATQVAWADAPEWQRLSALAGVQAVLANPQISAEQLHESWMKQKTDDGWVFGDEKDAIKKTHPCLVPYEQLPKEQRIKDTLFGSTVRSALRVYGLRWTHPNADNPRVIREQKSIWMCSDPLFDHGMFIITGRISIVADRVLGDLAVKLGHRVRATSTTYRNYELDQQIFASMLGSSADDAFGGYQASKWPEVVSAYKQREHWNVLFRLVQAMIGIEGVAARRFSGRDRQWEHVDEETGARSVIAVAVKYDSEGME